MVHGAATFATLNGMKSLFVVTLMGWLFERQGVNYVGMGSFLVGEAGAGQIRMAR